MKTKIQELQQLRSKYESLENEYKQNKHGICNATETFIIQRKLNRVASEYNEKRFFWLPKIKTRG